jgi:hypothetical protein
LGYPIEQDAAFAAARSYVRLSEDQLDEIRRRAAKAREGKGPCWWNPDPEAWKVNFRLGLMEERDTDEPVGIEPA